MILFQLGREYKLSLAEIGSVFPDGRFIYVDREVCIVEGLDDASVLNKAGSLGGTIKIASLARKRISEIAEDSEGKFQYGVSLLGKKQDLKKYLMNTKRSLKEIGINSRFVNKDFKNLSSAQIIGERLVKRGTDFTILSIAGEEQVYQTIWVQDIEAYAKRDYGKSRDMQVGMLPPKLCQVMINISGGTAVYDPFVGLGTVLIESVYMDNSSIFGSDLSELMVETSKKNLTELNKTKNLQR